MGYYPQMQKKKVFICPKCGNLFTYSATEFQFATKDGACHECVADDEEPNGP